MQRIQVLMCVGGCINQTFKLQALTGRVQGITFCDPGSPCVQLVARTIFGQRGAKVPCHFPFREQKFQGTKVPRSESSRERKFQTTKVPPMELLLPEAKVRGNESSSYRLQ